MKKATNGTPCWNWNYGNAEGNKTTGLFISISTYFDAQRKAIYDDLIKFVSNHTFKETWLTLEEYNTNEGGIFTLNLDYTAL